MRKLALYFLGTVGIGLASGAIASEVEERTEMETQPVIIKILILFLLGGLFHVATELYERKFEPQSWKDLKDKLPF